MDYNHILRRSAAACAALLVIAVPGAAQQSEDAAVAAATGPRACLPQPLIKRTKILDNRNIVFVTRQDEIYNNQLPKQCTSLNRRSLVNYGIANGRVCAGDRFQILLETAPKNFFPGPLCELGAFVPITEAELEDLTAMTEPDRERRPRSRSSREAVTTEKIELPRGEAAPGNAEPAPAE
jgi:hypothetical protein